MPPLDATSSSSDNESTPPPPKKRKRTHTTTSVEGQNGKTEASKTEDIEKMNHVEVENEAKNDNQNGNTEHVNEDDTTESLPDLTNDRSSEMNQEKNNTAEMDTQVNDEEKLFEEESTQPNHVAKNVIENKNETETKNRIKLEQKNIKSEEKTELETESKVKIERQVKTELKAELKTESKVFTESAGDKTEVKHDATQNGDGNESPKENVMEMNHDGDCETTLEYSADDKEQNGMKHDDGDGDTTVDYIEDVKEDVKEENGMRHHVVQKIQEAHDSVLDISKASCRAKHPLPPHQCVDAFIEKLKVKDEKTNQEKKEKDKEEFIPACLDESVVDVSAMALNTIAFVLKGNFINIYNYK